MPCVALGGFGFLQRGAGGLGALPRTGELDVKLIQPVALGEADCRLGRRTRADHEPVPTPDPALDRNENLARAQRRLQGFAVFAIRQQENVIEGASEGIRRGDRFADPGQRGIGRDGRQGAPVPGGAGLLARRELGAQRGAQCRFQPCGNLDAVQHRVGVAAEFLGEQGFQRIGFGLEPRRRGIRLGCGRAGADRGSMGFRAPRFRPLHPVLGLGIGGFSCSHCPFGCLAGGFRRGETFGRNEGGLCCGVRGFGFAGPAIRLAGGAAGLGQPGFHGLTLGLGAGGGFRRLLGCGFALGECGRRGLGLAPRLLDSGGSQFVIGGELRPLGLQPDRGGFGVARDPFGAGMVLSQGGHPRFGFAPGRFEARDLGIDLLGEDPCALEACARVRFARAQGRQRIVLRGFAAQHVVAKLFGVANRCFGLRELRARRPAPAFGELAFDGEIFSLGVADQPRDVPVAIGLAGLLAQLGEARLLLGAQVVGPEKVLLGRPQLEFGLVPAGVQAGDAGGFLQQGAPLVRAGVHQGGNPALADHRRIAGTGGEVGEQGRDIARAHFAPVDPVRTAAAALDLARDLEFRLVLERNRGEARGVGQGDRHFGKISRSTRHRAGENDVLHLAAAQGLGAGFAHRPAQRVDHVRLAAAVRPNDAGQPWQDVDRGRIGETLEPADPQAGETRGQAGPTRPSARRRRCRTKPLPPACGH